MRWLSGHGWVVERDATSEGEAGAVSIVRSGSQAGTVAGAGDLHVYGREEAGEWLEPLLSEDSEKLDQDGSSILEALYEQYATPDHSGHAAAPEPAQKEPADVDEPEGDEQQPEDD